MIIIYVVRLIAALYLVRRSNAFFVSLTVCGVVLQCGLGVGGRYLLDELITGAVIAYTATFRNACAICRIREAFRKVTFIDVIFLSSTFYYALQGGRTAFVTMYALISGNSERSLNRIALPIRHQGYGR